MSQEASELEVDAGKESQEALPAVDFSTFVMSLSHSAYIHLGAAPHPETNQLAVNLPIARQSIDLLSLIEQKTRGNLTGQEERLLEQILFDLRMRFVDQTKK